MDLDRSLARMLLRLALGLNLLVHGLVRVPALGKFADGIVGSLVARHPLNSAAIASSQFPARFDPDRS